MNNNELFENTSIPKAYFTMALPVVFSMVISLVYNMADTYFVAKTMNTNLVASVSLCAPIFTFIGSQVKDIILLVSSIWEVDITQSPSLHFVGNIVVLVVERLVIIA